MANYISNSDLKKLINCCDSYDDYTYYQNYFNDENTIINNIYNIENNIDTIDYSFLIYNFNKYSSTEYTDLYNLENLLLYCKTNNPEEPIIYINRDFIRKYNHLGYNQFAKKIGISVDVLKNIYIKLGILRIPDDIS